jgi:hypothetical protein
VTAYSYAVGKSTPALWRLLSPSGAANSLDGYLLSRIILAFLSEGIRCWVSIANRVLDRQDELLQDPLTSTVGRSHQKSISLSS